MRIGLHSNGISCEFEMQDKLREWLIKKDLKFIDELKIGEVGRMPDFLVWIPGKGLVNIEAKCNDFETMLNQLKDNSCYCNYSFAYIPDYSLTPEWVKQEFFKSKFGLLIYNYEHKLITEVFESHYNKGLNKQLKQIVLKKMDKELIRRKRILEPDLQQTLKI